MEGLGLASSVVGSTSTKVIPERTPTPPPQRANSELAHTIAPQRANSELAHTIENEARRESHLQRERTVMGQHKARQKLNERLSNRQIRKDDHHKEKEAFHSDDWTVLSGGGGYGHGRSAGQHRPVFGDSGDQPSKINSHKHVIARCPVYAQRWLHFCAIIDVFVWLIFLVVFTTYVQFDILSSPEAESAMTRQMKEFVGGASTLDDVRNEEQFFAFMKDTLIPNLTPTPHQPNAAMLKFREDYSTLDPTLHSINGVLFVLENKLWIRQVRCSSLTCGRTTNNYFSSMTIEKSGESQDKKGWLYNAANGNSRAPECQALQDALTPKEAVQYKENITTSTRADVHGHTLHFGRSGFVEHVNLGLGKNVKAENYTEAMALTRDCAQDKIRALQASRWVDDMTRIIAVEYCVAPWYSVPHYFNKTKVRDYLFPDHKGRTFDSGGACQRLVFFIDPHGFISSKQATMTTPIRIKDADNPTFQGLSRARINYFIIIITCIVFCVLKEGTELTYALRDGLVRSHYLNANNIIWNVLDLVNVISLIYSLVKFPDPSQAPFGENINTTYSRFEGIENLNEAKGAFAIVLLFWYVRGVEYMGLMPWFQLPINAMSNSFYNLLTFGVFFLFIMWGASVAFRFLFATASEDQYGTLANSLTTLSLGSLGELSYESVMADYRFRSIELWSIAWAFVAAFVLLTMFVAIVDQGFQDAKEALHPVPEVNDNVIVTQDVRDHKPPIDTSQGQQQRVTVPVKDNQGHVIEYEGIVESVNPDGTFDVRFDVPDEFTKTLSTQMRVKSTETETRGDQPVRMQTCLDTHLNKKHVRMLHPPDLADGVLIATLREHFQPILTRHHLRGLCGMFVGWWGTRVLDRLACRPLRKSLVDKEMNDQWVVQFRKYILYRRAVSGFLETVDRSRKGSKLGSKSRSWYSAASATFDAHPQEWKVNESGVGQNGEGSRATF